MEVYLRNWGHRYEEKETIHFRQDQSREYPGEPARLIAAVSGERVTISEKNIIVSADAARALED